ncbi:hypothetical protein L226DRAFT_159965 [Lentinus tigrinus ALCF2SS1-7]|uniref:Uncharacterized protein n=1 Tax=Lentinus tigrinus ALCF2SS1-6 TaxID=1328759 RepID=A0A5C2S1L0_9APHY|nr:hypothetical protein L227DRAFT_228734 [Lentinus tigrinus ALCF2SS1-6]RPD71994.1 hypothetical protein L226DRAFT_159965 [Lentinus tigrinus ALCF2SS1-7]
MLPHFMDTYGVVGRELQHPNYMRSGMLLRRRTYRGFASISSGLVMTLGSGLQGSWQASTLPYEPSSCASTPPNTPSNPHPFPSPLSLRLPAPSVRHRLPRPRILLCASCLGQSSPRARRSSTSTLPLVPTTLPPPSASLPSVSPSVLPLSRILPLPSPDPPPSSSVLPFA